MRRPLSGARQVQRALSSRFRALSFRYRAATTWLLCSNSWNLPEHDIVDLRRSASSRATPAENESSRLISTSMSVVRRFGALRLSGSFSTLKKSEPRWPCKNGRGIAVDGQR